MSTRDQIVAAATALRSANKPLTVSAISREAKISRATFYTHFAGIDELAAFVYERVLEDVSTWQRSALDSGDGWREPEAQFESFRRFAISFSENLDLFATIFALPAGSDVRLRATKIVAETLERRVYTNRITPPPGISPHIVTSALGAAYMDILARWSSGEITLTADELASYFYELMPDWLSDPAS